MTPHELDVVLSELHANVMRWHLQGKPPTEDDVAAASTIVNAVRYMLLPIGQVTTAIEWLERTPRPEWKTGGTT